MNMKFTQQLTKAGLEFQMVKVIVLNAPDNSYTTLKEFVQKIKDLLKTDLRPGPIEIK